MAKDSASAERRWRGSVSEHLQLKEEGRETPVLSKKNIFSAASITYWAENEVLRKGGNGTSFCGERGASPAKGKLDYLVGPSPEGEE